MTLIDNITRTLTGRELGGISADTFARIALSLITDPGDPQIGQLITGHGAADTLHLLNGPKQDRQADELRERVSQNLRPEMVTTAVKTTIDYGYQLLVPNGEGWPHQLDDLGDTRPHLLWAHGNSALLSSASRVALVGARASTAYGEHITMELTAHLVEHGYTVVSGAAYGIDGMAHRAALASRGNTVAVVAGGVDRHYPSGHDALLTRIAEAGVIVSEMPPGTMPSKVRFLGRNRIIAALAQSTIVVEAGYRSGALNTAGHAIALGRPLGAVPGPVTSAASAGCHGLIRDHGAVLVTDGNDVRQL